jgi:hypothetical protein
LFLRKWICQEVLETPCTPEVMLNLGVCMLFRPTKFSNDRIKHVEVFYCLCKWVLWNTYQHWNTFYLFNERLKCISSELFINYSICDFCCWYCSCVSWGNIFSLPFFHPPFLPSFLYSLFGGSKDWTQGLMMLGKHFTTWARHPVI